MPLIVRGLLLSAAALCSTPVLAHTPYLLPNAFDPERDHVTLSAALTEDDYFNPDIALRVPAYVETSPSGATQQVTPAAVLKDVAVAEADLPEPGTYRFSTGAFVARRMKMALIGGKWLMVRGGDRRPEGERPHGDGHKPGQGPSQGRPPGGGGEGPPGVAAADVPADAKTMEVKGVMTAETYVSKGAPTDAALKTSGQGLELKPLVHPNSIYVDQGFPLQFLLDGAPAAGVPITVYRSGNLYDDRKIEQELKTGADGKAKASFTRPGVYLLTAHYPAAGPRDPAATPPSRNFTYSLTFEVTR